MHKVFSKGASAVLLMLLTLGGCATTVEPTMNTRYPLEFNVAMKALAEQLFTQVRNNQNVLTRIGNTTLVVDPFIDANTAEVTETSREIEQEVYAEAKRAFPNFAVERMNANNIGKANYVIGGIIRLDDYQSGAKTGGRFYRVSASVTDLKTGVVIANTDVWVANKALKHAAVGTYQESPMYLKDRRTEGYITTAVTAAGNKADQEYFASLPTAALLVEADKAYEDKRLKDAESLLKMAETRPDGKVMKTYAALYLIYRKLNQPAEAEKMFARLVDVGLENKNISTRLLFSVNSTDFVSDSDLREQYSLWLRQIGRKVASSNSCLHIVGHSSRTGAERYNDSLSRQRAEAVQSAMLRNHAELANKVKADGRGFRDNIIGSGSDDAQDAIDRRVEFTVVSCK